MLPGLFLHVVIGRCLEPDALQRGAYLVSQAFMQASQPDRPMVARSARPCTDGDIEDSTRASALGSSKRAELCEAPSGDEPSKQ